LPFGPTEVALGDGLVVRAARPSDTDRLVAFNTRIHRSPDEQPGMAAQLGGAVRSLMEGRTPGTDAGDFLVVEDTRDGAIASSLCVIAQSWRYDGVPFGVHQVEFVGTDPAYRRRGLVRRQMELVHRRAAAEGRPVQVIDGIDWYYRQFGYEYALPATRGGRLLAPPGAAGGAAAAAGGPGGSTAGAGHPGGSADGGTLRLRARAATAADAAFLEATYRAAMGRYLVSVERRRREWLADLEGYDPGNHHRPVQLVIEDGDGRPAGWCSYWASFHNPARTPTRLWIGGLELAPERDWATWGRPLVDCLRDLAGRLAAERGVAAPTIGVRLGGAHPFYDLGVGEEMDPREGSVWYVRVELPEFLRRIAPALERRLAASPAAGHGGTLALSFYRGGVKVRFEVGRVAAVERWAPGQDEGDAWFPELTFLQLLLGYRSMAELQYAFPDCGARDAATRGLLEALFPKRPSYTWLLV
jgi:predicted N-acetyltransferase YhbS